MTNSRMQIKKMVVNLLDNINAAKEDKKKRFIKVDLVSTSFSINNAILSALSSMGYIVFMTIDCQDEFIECKALYVDIHRKKQAKNPFAL